MSTYYVKINGGTGSGLDDSNAWSYSYYNTNFNAISSGDTVLFKAGETFYGRLRFKSGVSGNPITYNRYGATNLANPVITGFTTINTSSWSLVSGKPNIYSATISSSTVNTVVVNGQVRGMGRYPKATDANKGYLDYEDAGEDGTGTYLTDTNYSMSKPMSAFAGGEVVYRSFSWILDRHKNISISGNKIYYTTPTSTSDPFWTPYTAHAPIKFVGNGYFFQNHIECLTEDKDWYFNAVGQTFYMYITGALSSYSIKVCTLPIVVDEANLAYVNINNISFEGGNDCTISIPISNNVKLTGCTIFASGSCAIYGDSSNAFEMTEGMIDSVMDTAIKLKSGCNNTKISGVSLSKVGTIAGGAPGCSDDRRAGLLIHGNNNIIEECRFEEVGYKMLDFRGDNYDISFNYFSGFCRVTDDGAAIYSYIGTQLPADVPQSSNRVIRNNIIRDGSGALEGKAYYVNNGSPYAIISGIYLDDNVNNVEIKNNTIESCSYAGIHLHNASSINIHDNLSYNSHIQLLIQEDISAGSVHSNILQNNDLITIKSTDITAEYRIFNSIDTFGNFFSICDNNKYCKPLFGLNTLQITTNYNNVVTNKSVDGWKTLSGVDVHSLDTPIVIDNINKLLYSYNDSLISSNALNLGNKVYVDNMSRIYTSAYPVPIMGSAILFDTGQVVEPSGKITIKGNKVRLV